MAKPPKAIITMASMAATESVGTPESPAPKVQPPASTPPTPIMAAPVR